MASPINFEKVLKRLRSGRGVLITPQPPIELEMPNRDNGRDYEQKPQPWQGLGNKRKKPHRS